MEASENNLVKGKVMKIHVLGSGCEKCKKLADNVQEAVAKLGVECEVEKVTDINRIVGFGVLMTPALVVDGKVVSSGKVLSPDEVEAVLKSAGPGEIVETEKNATEKKEEQKASCSCCSPAPAAEKDCGGGTDAPSCPFCGKKKFFTNLLLLFIVGSIAFMVFKEIKAKNTAATAGKESVLPNTDKKGVLFVYYFHGNKRCMTCNRIEELTKQALQAKFAGQLADGKVVFRSVNLDEPANEHFIKDFQLAAKTVVMQKDGKFEKFDEVWDLAGEPAKFTGYIQSGAEKMLK